MRPAARWLVVAAVAVGLAASPSLVRAIPAQTEDLDTLALAEKMRAGHGTGWSGEVRVVGSLRVPVDGAGLGGVARLLGQETRLRVWWRDPETWRVDRLRRGGETDLAVGGGLATRWDSESRKVRVMPYAGLRLPDDVDVLPLTLARRLLADANEGELTRLRPQRVAGRSAAGLRLEPADRRSTVARVDLWADDETGVPLRVEVYDAQSRRPVLVSQVTDFEADRPAARDTTLHLDPGLSFGRGESFAETMEQRALMQFRAPSELAGLARQGDAPAAPAALGAYGRGPTAFLVLALRDSVSTQLRTQLRRSPSSRDTRDAVALEAGPVSVLLADLGREGWFLLTGTVTPQTLVAAARDLDRR